MGRSSCSPSTRQSASEQESEAQTPSELGAPLLEEFLRLRDSLRDQPLGDGGRQVCEALTLSLDTALQTLVSEVDWGLDHALVAIGGYGRSELSLFSDVDLMLLHEPGGDPAEIASGVFRALWDSSLRVGHSVRTVKEAAAAARDRFETHTTLLTSRLVAGSTELFDQLSDEIAAVTKARPLRHHLVAEERERRRRSPYLRMATDVKNGRGGLRTLQGFEWLQRREDLIGRFSTGASPEERTAYETLLAIRNAIHARAGRSFDVFAYDLREPAAHWLGSDVPDVSARLMRAIEAADRIASRRWPELADTEHSGPRRIWSRLWGRTGVETATRPSFVDLAAIARSGERGRLRMDRLRETGLLSQILPEWEEVRAAPQLAPFHEHPVAAHLWRTVDEMQDLVEGDDDHYATIAREIDDPDVLTLAAFLHDIGKGRDGDHSDVGARIVQSLCIRLGCPDELSALLEGAVRHHLLLSHTATRRDIDDPAVVDDVVGQVESLRLLQVLYLLTVADSRATGPNMWNEWKAQLVRTLFFRCAARFGAARAVGPPLETRESVLAEARPGLRPAVTSHLDGLSDEYLRSTTSSDVLWHVGLIVEMEGSSNVDVRSGEAADTVAVVGARRGDFRRIVAEVFAANGIDVLEARMATRTDGIIVDSYQVRDDRTGGRVPDERWDRVRADVESALSGDLDAESKVAVRADAYSSVTRGSDIEPRVRISVDRDPSDAVITVECSDRIGRLAEILSVLGGSGIDIRLAKLDSRGGQLIDTFHVLGDSLPTDPTRLENLRRQIEESLER